MTAAKLPLRELPDWPALMEPEAAVAYLRLGRTVFDCEVRGAVRVVRIGTLTLYPRAELDKWIAKNAKATLREAA